MASTCVWNGSRLASRLGSKLGRATPMRRDEFSAFWLTELPRCACVSVQFTPLAGAKGSGLSETFVVIFRSLAQCVQPTPQPDHTCEPRNKMEMSLAPELVQMGPDSPRDSFGSILSPSRR